MVPLNQATLIFINVNKEEGNPVLSLHACSQIWSSFMATKKTYCYTLIFLLPCSLKQSGSKIVSGNSPSHVFRSWQQAKKNVSPQIELLFFLQKICIISGYKRKQGQTFHKTENSFPLVTKFSL